MLCEPVSESYPMSGLQKTCGIKSMDDYKKTCGTKLTDDLRFPLWCTICRYIERIHSCCTPTGHLFIPPKCWVPNSQTNNMSITSFHLSGKLLRVCPKYLSGLPLSSPAFVKQEVGALSTRYFHIFLWWWRGWSIFSKLSNTFNRNQYWYYASLDSSILT